ncbi:MAG: Gldg family protein [Lentisphaerae bacterium]|nr:Gldg family protein [Lentisphaerota bacterium]
MKARQLWKFAGSLIGLLTLLAILIAANVLLSRVRVRADLTEEKLYTLAEGTRTILQSLDVPVTLKFFFSGNAPEIPMPLKYFAQQVEDLLKEYELTSGGRVRMETYDPKPDSDAEEWAQRYGLAGQQLGLMGPELYLGLVAVKGDAHAILPFLDPRNEELLEYNITQLIARLANPKKPAIGILSSLPVMGVRSFPYALPGQPRPKSQPPWVAFQDLEKDYEVRQLPAEPDVIDTNLDALVVVHPKNLSEKTLYALDQFVLQGGRLLAFIDPFCLAEAMSQEQSMGMAHPMSELSRLTTAWGINYEPDKVVADLDASTRVRRSDNTVENNPVFLSLRQFNIDGKDIITSALESLALPTAGAFSGTPAAGLSVGSLLVSSDQSELINTMTAQMGEEAVRREFRSGLKRLNLAIRLHGKFQTAFPEGKPKAAPAPDKEAAEPEKEAQPPEDTAPALKESAKPTTVILVADVDLLYDAFAVQELPFFGQRVFQPLNDNINFLANALEQLAGSAALSQIRARGRFDRPFDRVLELQRAAQQRWLLQERALQEQLEATRQRLDSLQASKDKSQRFILSPEQEAEIARFKQEQIKTQRELKQVRKNLREGIERLGVAVKAINILSMPVLVCLAGMAFAWHRRRSVEH